MSLRKFKAISARGFKFIKPIKFYFLCLCKFDAALGFEQKFKICMLAEQRTLFDLRKFKRANKVRKSALSRKIICA